MGGRECGPGTKHGGVGRGTPFSGDSFLLGFQSRVLGDSQGSPLSPDPGHPWEKPLPCQPVGPGPPEQVLEKGGFHSFESDGAGAALSCPHGRPSARPVLVLCPRVTHACPGSDITAAFEWPSAPG